MDRELLYVAYAVFALAFVSMVAYAILRPAQDADASRKGTRFLLGIGDFLVHWFLWLVSPAERLFVRMGLTPDTFNLLGVVFGLASGVAFAKGQLELGGWAIALGGLCDVLDGRIARLRGMASPYGKFIDSSLDRFAEVFAFLGLVVYFHDRPLGAFLAASTLAGSLLVSYVQARGETVQISGAGGLMQRAERLVALLLVTIFDPPLCAWRGWAHGSALVAVLALMAPATFGTAVYRTLWIARRLKSN
jgi:CDP-diacylglycerol--glycerol-3-phosphate 3-phosphatidyltransferase